ncbi:MAG: hypothetical protein ACPGSC_11625, partial [Granulosicoccaceae bacterium]
MQTQEQKKAIDRCLLESITRLIHEHRYALKARKTLETTANELLTIHAAENIQLACEKLLDNLPAALYDADTQIQQFQSIAKLSRNDGSPKNRTPNSLL